MKMKLLTAVAGLVACSSVFAEEKTVTICDDYVSDGGYSYRVKEAGERCQRAQSKTTKQRFRYINEGWGKNLYEQYLADEKIECAEFNALFLEGPPPKTIERRCETYIDNRAKEG